MDSQSQSPIDGTPGTSLSRVVLVAVAGFSLAFAFNPESLGRWGYMLNDSPAIRPIQVAAETVSDGAAGFWRSAGLRSPYDMLREVARRGRLLAGASE